MKQPPYPAHWIVPAWPAPAQVKAVITTRQGGTSATPYASFNLASHVGDDAAAVARNRMLLRRWLPAEPVWLTQVHGTTVVNADITPAGAQADASTARHRSSVCAVLTADCLPLLLCDEQGTVVSAAHAGWRGLCAGIIEATIDAMEVTPSRLLAYLGPAIGPQAFEVGEDVRTAFLAQSALAATAFRPATPGKWLADLYTLARLRLQGRGVHKIYGGNYCTMGDTERFYSFRRDNTTGRMASLVWLA